jgi:calcineurin-like phosphoesterase family protein
MKEESTRPLDPDICGWTVTRRKFLKSSSLVIAGLSFGSSWTNADSTNSKIKLSFGIVTDAHYADRDSNNTRQYRESATKMTECIALMNAKKVDFLIELGDFKDQNSPAREEETLEYLVLMEKIYAQFNGARYHVLGNHDVDSISKQQFLDHVQNTGILKESTYYSFDSKGFHFIVLDANYKSDESNYDRGNFHYTDTNIPLKQIDWLKKDLASSSTPVIVFVHQQLDITGNAAVNNAAQIRQVLQDSKKTIAVFQGHHHAGHYSYIEGIHYYTLKAMVEGSGKENNSYAIVNVHADSSITINGYRKALSKELKKT